MRPAATSRQCPRPRHAAPSTAWRPSTATSRPKADDLRGRHGELLGVSSWASWRSAPRMPRSADATPRPCSNSSTGTIASRSYARARRAPPRRHAEISEAQYDVFMLPNMISSPHGWSAWRAYATFYAYLLTGEERWLRETLDAARPSPHSSTTRAATSTGPSSSTPMCRPLQVSELRHRAHRRRRHLRQPAS